MKLQIRTILLSILDFFGSMSFAITLLISVSIVALIGTLITQGQGDDFYLNEFGPLWAELFDTLSVNDIFNSSGFFVLIGLLFLSISICIWRRAPVILQEFSGAGRTRPDTRAEYIQQSEWQSNSDSASTVADIKQHLHDNKYKFSVIEKDGLIHIFARKGMLQRLGYLCVHFGVLVIILGALLDANIPLRYQLSSDDLQTTSVRSLANESDILDVDSGSFRGSQDFGVNDIENVVVLKTDKGYIRRKLPFSIKLKDFDIKYYANGKPMTFASTIDIQRDGSEDVEQFKVAVEKGIELDGYRIYQRGYRDAGSGLNLVLWDLGSADENGSNYNVNIPISLAAEQTRLPVNIQIVDFSKDNSNPLASHTLQQDFSSIGPAVRAKITNQQGLNVDIIHYLNPINKNKKQYYLIGVRHELDRNFTYGYIPVEKNGQLNRLIKLNALLNDKKKVRSIIRTTATETLKQLEIESRVIRNEWISEMENMTKLFLEGGSAAVLLAYQPAKPTNRLDEINAETMARLQNLIQVFYTYVLDEKKDLKKGKETISPRLMKSFNEIFTALDWMKSNQLQVLFKVNNFNHKQGSVLEISYYPGYYPVLFGMFLLLVGIMMMFYIHHRRLELTVSAQGSGSQVSFIGSSRKSPVSLKNEYDRLLNVLK